MARHRILIFLGFTFGLTWLYWFAVVYPLSNGDQNLLAGAIGIGMFFPAISVVFTRLVTKEGFSQVWITPRSFKKNWKYYLLGWFGPMILILLGAGIYFLIFSNDFDPTMNHFYELQKSDLQKVIPDFDVADIKKMVWLQLGLIPLGPIFNFLPVFGEEWGWRGYLLPKMMAKYSLQTTLLLSGVIWGIWHAPIIYLGHNYGIDYWGFPVLGILAMCVFTIMIGVFLSYLTLRTGSVIPAVFAHGAINGTAAVGILFSSSGGNPFIGPLPTGIIGGLGFIIAAIWAYISLQKRQRNDISQFDGETEVQSQLLT